jgi:hypothetical protein
VSADAEENLAMSQELILQAREQGIILLRYLHFGFERWIGGFRSGGYVASRMLYMGWRLLKGV